LLTYWFHRWAAWTYSGLRLTEAYQDLLHSCSSWPESTPAAQR
jgi:hypothetical protein